MDDMVRRNTDRETLCQVIQQWNANRLDLFALTNPNENLEFQGVMRFYFQDIGQKVATKCVRVSSVQSTKEIIDCLIEKFRPDMRMLTIPDYALYEIHENGDERRLGQEEKPLLVQLNWHRDDREGRFLLRRIDGATPIFPPMGDESQFRRKLSKREKKQLKKQEKLRRLKSGDSPEHGHHGSMSEQGGTLRGDGSSVAEKLYSELPETSFTRSISNPEAVMRRRRQQKLERKLQLFRSRDGGPDTGGTLKIYGESLCREVPYKTLLLSVHDTAINIVQEMLDKYGIPREEAPNYCLVEVQVPDPPPGSGGSPQAPREYILDDDECPLAILMTQTGSITFHVRRRPPDHMARRRKKKQKQAFDAQGRPLTGDDALPYFLELQPDGTEIRTQAPMRHRLQLNVTEVGCERGNSAGGALLQLFGPGVQSRHCVLAHMEGIVTVTPCSRDAETFVNGQRIYETTLLQHGAIVRFGSSRTFRFMDPMYEDRQPRPPSGSLERGSFASSNLETTFDPEGNVDTVSVGSYQPHNDSRRSWASQHSRSMAPLGTDPILPATLELPEETEEQVLLGLTTSPDPNSTPFKLAPTYSLYMVARYRASVHFRPDLSPPERAIRLTHTLTKASRMIEHTVQAAARDASSLSFWMANSSELLHFLKSDRHISAYSLDAQDILAESVQAAFGFLVDALQVDLDAYLPGILSEDPLGPTGDTRADRMDPILTTLSGTMGLLRRCRVNAALTIQLFSHLFHFLNRWVFNKLVEDAPPNYCTRAWGLRLRERLHQLEVWAEKQGLELAADCHLARLTQAAHLLQSPKWTAEDLASLCSACFKLNSLQLNHLLSQYQPEEGEPQVPPEQVDKVVRVCEVSVDELLRADGRPVRLEEEPELSLPFVLPEDGYSCEILRGIPQGLPEFLAPLQSNGLCRLIPQPTSSGYWTVYMGSIDQRTMSRPSSSMSRGGATTTLPNSQASTPTSGHPPPSRTARNSAGPEIQTIQLRKSNAGMGLSIVAAKGVDEDRLGIYIKSVVQGGAAYQDGRLQTGDQLLSVDGHSLVGITQEKAAEIMTRTGSMVTLQVAKQGAIYHGLAALLSQPSPTMSRAATLRPTARDSVSSQSSRIAASRSVPSLNTAVPPESPTRRFAPEIQYPAASAGPTTTSSHLRSRSQQNLVQSHRSPYPEDPRYSARPSSRGPSHSPPMGGPPDQPPPRPPKTHHGHSASESRASPQQQHGRPKYPPASSHGGSVSPFRARQSAWEREERDAERRKEAARIWRDEQIGTLEAIPHRTPKEEDHLRSLRREREFQRRADEANGEDEPPSPGAMPAPAQPVPPGMTTSVNGTPLYRAEIVNNNTIMTPQAAILTRRDQKVEEMRETERQLKAAREAEARIIEEARRRREEDLARRGLTGRGSPAEDGNRNVSAAPRPPSPPERGSSYNVLQRNQLNSHVSLDSNANKAPSTPVHPEVFFSEAESMLQTQITPPSDSVGGMANLSIGGSASSSGLDNSGISTTNTPNVIGTQEVYRDPRLRRLAAKMEEQQKNQQPGNPEKMSFRDKMKLFAKTVNEEGNAARENAPPAAVGK